jgi:hypothetical protein
MPDNFIKFAVDATGSYSEKLYLFEAIGTAV